VNNGNYCECCEHLGEVEMYLDDEDNAVDLCPECHASLVERSASHGR
jgi:hypothetical protein